MVVGYCALVGGVPLDISAPQPTTTTTNDACEDVAQNQRVDGDDSLLLLGWASSLSRPSQVNLVAIAVFPTNKTTFLPAHTS